MILAKSKESNAENGTIVDVKLFKVIGLWQTLNPTMYTDSVLNGRLYKWVLQVFFWMMFITIVSNTVMLREASNDFQRFMYLSMLIIISINNTIKVYVLLNKSDQMSAVLDLAQYAFTSCSRRDPSLLSQCRGNLFALLRAIVVINYVVTAIWSVLPFFIDEPLSVIQLDGTVRKYRVCIVNVWVPLSYAMYNTTAGWYLVYVYELFMMVCNILAWVMFDIYMITMCFALNVQFRILAAGYEALGNGPCTGLFNCINKPYSPTRYSS